MIATNKFAFAAGAVHVWRASLDGDDRAVAQCAALLNAVESARAQRFHFDRDRRRFTLARGLLRQLLGQYLGQDPAAVPFAAGPHGKPMLDQAGAALRFNLSHSGTEGLFAFAENREVGIDLEAGLRLGDDWPGLARRIFSAREQAELASLPADLQRAAFLNGWTRKEAYLKATGEGLTNGLRQIEVTLDPRQPAAFLSSEFSAEWSLTDLRIAGGPAAALATAGTPSALQIFTAPAELPAPPRH